MKEISFEEHNKVSGIYLISFNKGEYKYVGQSNDIWNRKKQHLYVLSKQKQIINNLKKIGK